MESFGCSGPSRGHYWPGATAGDRRVGARLLPSVQEREARLCEDNIQGCELGRRPGETHRRHELSGRSESRSLLEFLVIHHPFSLFLHSY